MRRALAALLPLTLLLASCETTVPAGRARPHVLSATRTDQAVEGRATWGMPIEIPGQPTSLVPYSRERALHLLSDRDNFSEGGLAEFLLGHDERTAQIGAQRRVAGSLLRWHNAIVVDGTSGAQWPLLEQRGVLSRYWMRLDPSQGGYGSSALLFAATVADTNGDGYLDDQDARRALLCDPDGRAPRFVSPAGTQLREVHFAPERNQAILMIASDANGDGVFSDREPPEPYVLELAGAGEARRMIDPEVRARVEAALGPARG